MHDSPDLLRISAPDAARRVSALLARAFQDDPLMRYALPDASQRTRLLPYLIGLNVRYALRYGEVYTTSGFEGAAVWLPPGRTTMTPWRMARAGMFAAPLKMPWPVLRRLARVGSRVTALHERCAPGPHWYLSQISVEPSRQRQGIGSRLLAPMLVRIDAAGLPCYLETENPANVTFYQHHGFRVVAEDAAPGGGPRIWAILRTV
ncbi:MAG TPA: GNAT family N-acetyltransferase [Ktedonobacterales bacterium]|nr:GNAT family N-acetyltransferase [Ktedonobacterales bacterium]